MLRSRKLADGGVADADVEVVDEQGDGGSAHADLIEVAVDAQGDFAGGVDAVVADPVVRGGRAGGACFGSGSSWVAS